MGLRIPTGVECKCDGNECSKVVNIPIQHIKSGFTKANIIKKLRQIGWYVALKQEKYLCPDCRDKMGLPNTRKNKKGDDLND